MSKKLGKTKQNRGGRPTKKKQEEIRKDCQEHYESYHSAAYTAQITGYNRNTINAYFKEFNEMWLTETNADFIMKQKNAKDKALGVLDTRIADYEDQLTQVKATITHLKQDEDDEVDIQDWSRLQFLRLQINQQIVKTTDQKATLEITPTIDISLEAMREEDIESACLYPRVMSFSASLALVNSLSAASILHFTSCSVVILFQSALLILPIRSPLQTSENLSICVVVLVLI